MNYSVKKINILIVYGQVWRKEINNLEFLVMKVLIL